MVRIGIRLDGTKYEVPEKAHYLLHVASWWTDKETGEITQVEWELRLRRDGIERNGPIQLVVWHDPRFGPLTFEKQLGRRWQY